MKWVLVLLLFTSCSKKVSNIDRIHRIIELSEENTRIRQRIILQQLDYNIDWCEVDSLYDMTYKNYDY
jgi:hypothetical protein